ncbi:MAG: hypothetical protein GXX86_05810, partial [Propionibacterium sp.]|nr:hypothetical protein [Propionibacterium sp.]
MSDTNTTHETDVEQEILPSSAPIRTASLPRWLPYALIAGAMVVGLILNLLIT